MEKILKIALDGPSGSGKSTIAKLLSKELNILYLDTGAMYRATALKAIKENINYNNEEEVNDLIRFLNLNIEYKNGNQITKIDDEDVSEKIRENSVSMVASDISKFTSVRNKMVEMQREIASKISCVLDGRDIGSVVLPNADFKFYITASVEERANRRFLELKSKGQNVNLNNIKKEILERDYNDTHRINSPLVKANDAILIDTTGLTINQVKNNILNYIRKK